MHFDPEEEGTKGSLLFINVKKVRLSCQLECVNGLTAGVNRREKAVVEPPREWQ